jgi:hypothetical protein
MANLDINGVKTLVSATSIFVIQPSLSLTIRFASVNAMNRWEQALHIKAN